MDPCQVCGFIPRNEEENTKGFKYACCRAIVTSLPASGQQILCCKFSDGKYLQSVPDTSTNPDAFKENFIKKYEQKGCKDKPE